MVSIERSQAPWILFAHSARRTSHSFAWHLMLGLILVAYFIALMFVENSMGMIGAPGLSFYRNIAYLNLILIAVAGTGYFSVCVTAERDAGTLDLLRISDLGSIGQMIGIWLPTVLATGMLLLLQIPCTLFAVTLGGILPDYIRAVTVATLVHLCLVSSIGFLISVFSKSSRHAVFLSLAVFGVWFAGPDILQTTLGWLWPTASKYLETPFEQLRLLSAFGSLERIEMTAPTGPSLWGREQTIQMLLAASALVIGVRNWEQQTASGPVADSLRAGQRPAYLWSEGLMAVSEKDFRLSGGWNWFALRVIAYPVLGSIYAGGFGSTDWGKYLEAALHMVAWDSTIVLSQLFQREVRDRTWSSLRLLPYSIDQLCYSKLAGAMLALSPGWVWCSYVSFEIVSRGVWQSTPIDAMYWGSIVVFGCHVATMFSVLVPRITWTIPMILGVVAGNLQFRLGQAIVISLGLRGSNSEFMARMLMISLGLSAILHGIIAWRLRELSD